MPRRRRLSSRLLAALVPSLVRLVSVVLGLLPRRAALAVGRGLGRLAWIAGRRDRRRALDHLALAFPELAEADRRRLARDNFLHQGMNLAELLHLWRRDPAEILPHVEIAGWAELEAARASGRRVLVLTGHCGNFELLSPVLAVRGIPVAAVARPAEDPKVQEMMVALRGHLGAKTIARGSRGASRQLLETLRGGGLLAMLIDQDTKKVDGVWVPFFGRPAWTPVGAAEIALRHKAKVVPFFIERREDGDHLLRFHPVLDLPDDPVEATARMTAKIEEQVRRRPEQWVWQHRRWRRQPLALADVTSG